MDNKQLLISAIKKYAGIDPVREKDLKNISESTIGRKERKLLQVRDKLMTVGKILEEDLKNENYVVSIPVGPGGMSAALVALTCSMKDIYIAAYAKEGLIKQHLAEKAVQKIVKILK